MKNKTVAIVLGLGILGIVAYRKIEGVMFQKYYLIAQGEEISKYRDSIKK